MSAKLHRRYYDLVPLRALADGFRVRGRRVSFGSFYSDIFRPEELEGPGGLPRDRAAEERQIGAVRGHKTTDRFTYRFRTAKSGTPRVAAAGPADDNRALVAAHELAVSSSTFAALRQASTS